MSLDPLQRYKFEMNVGYACNFSCKYCYQPVTRDGLAIPPVTAEQLSRFADYMIQRIKQIGGKHEWGLSVYGGEPLLYLDRLIVFFRKIQMFFDNITIVTNAALIEQKQEQLLRLHRMLGCKLCISPSYDFCMQDQNRQEGTYSIVRDAIRWLDKSGIRYSCTTVFTVGSLPRIWDVFSDFVELKRECPRLNACFNLAGGVDAPLDEPAVRAALEKMKAFVNENPEYGRAFFYNLSTGHRRRRWKHAPFGNVICAMIGGGELYPGYDMHFRSQFAQDALRLGNIADDFSEITRKHTELLANLPHELPEQCQNCNILCRVIPWCFMKDDLSQYYDKPSDERCKTLAILTEYFPSNDNPPGTSAW